MGTTTISVRISDSQLLALKKEATVTHTSINRIARAAIDLYIEVEHPVHMNSAAALVKRRTHRKDTVSVVGRIK